MIEPRASVHLRKLRRTIRSRREMSGMRAFPGLRRWFAGLPRRGAISNQRWSALSKARDESARLKPAESENDDAELQNALQQERERGGRLEQELAAVRHDVEAQGALAAKAAEDMTRDRQAAQGSLVGIGNFLAAGARAGQPAGAAARGSAPRCRNATALAGKRPRKRRGQAGRGEHFRGAAKSQRCSESARRPRSWHRKSRPRAPGCSPTRLKRAGPAKRRQRCSRRRKVRQSCGNP